MSTNEVEMPEAEVAPDSKGEEIEFVKPKKKTCRRGKKRKYKNSRTVSEESTQNDTAEMYWHSETAECKKRAKNVLIRPVDAPNAPRNSTQFIIDDHDECHLYISFEHPNPNHMNNADCMSSCNTTENEFEEAAFQDIDYVYHSMHDRDSNTYYLQDFELSYSNMRYEELLHMQKPELISALENLECRIKEIESKLYEQDPFTALEQLQRKLLQLQEENNLLHEMNVNLKHELETTETCGGSDDVSQPDEVEHSQSDDSQSCSDNSCEGCEECCEENNSRQQSFCVHGNPINPSKSHNSSIYFNHYKDFMHLAIGESSKGSCNERDGNFSTGEEQESIQWVDDQVSEEEQVSEGEQVSEEEQVSGEEQVSEEESVVCSPQERNGAVNENSEESFSDASAMVSNESPKNFSDKSCDDPASNKDEN